MNAVARILIGTCVAVCVFANGAETSLVYRLTLGLRDGSRIVGAAKFSTFPLKTAYAEVKLALSQIQNITVAEKAGTVTVLVVNGDKLTGVPGRDVFELSTCFGDVEVKLEHITSFTFATPIGAAADAGLVLYLPFNGNARDASGQGNDGQAVGAALVPDRMNRPNAAYRFDGVDDRMTFPNTAVRSLQSHTVAFWVRRLGDGQDSGRLFQNGTVNTGITIAQNHVARNILHRLGPSWDNTLLTTADRLCDDWVFVACTYDGKSQRIYCDGVEIMNRTENMAVPAGAGELGFIGGDNYGQTFDGVIDEVRVYNRALSAAEVKELSLRP